MATNTYNNNTPAQEVSYDNTLAGMTARAVKYAKTDVHVVYKTLTQMNVDFKADDVLKALTFVKLQEVKAAVGRHNERTTTDDELAEAVMAMEG